MSSKRPSAIQVYWLLFATFACAMVLMVYFYHLTLPGQIIKHPIVSCKANQESTISNPNAVYHETEAVVNTNLIPIMDFEDLGVNKKKVMLLIVVTSAPRRFDRRQAIRDTWWKHCTGNKVQCVFISDGFIVDHVQRNLTIREKYFHQDMELLPLRGGWELGLRLLNYIKWSVAKFDFQYLLRIDDDYFLCLKRLLSELPLRPKENLVWGHFHCELGMAWADEGFMLYSQDIIHKFLSQNKSTMLCHPFGGQQVALWLKNIPTKLYFHDVRLHHDPPASYFPKFKDATNVCDSYLGLHGTYPEKMRYFGKNSNDSAKDVHPIPNFSSYCGTLKFDHRRFRAPFKYDPKPCIDNPSWDLKNDFYAGREKH